jgi:tetratricopeptide (TPR) repeat protein
MKKKPISFSDRIWQMFQKGEYARARKLLLDDLKKCKKLDNHWLLSRISSTYYEERKYRTALAYVNKAMKLAPHCPMVLWDYAGTLDMLCREKKAITIWKNLLRRGANGVAFGECGEGLKRAKGLMLDCYYRLALAHRDLEKFRQARYYMMKHINGRYPGNGSIYSLTEAKQKLKDINDLSQKAKR